MHVSLSADGAVAGCTCLGTGFLKRQGKILMLMENGTRNGMHGLHEGGFKKELYSSGKVGWVASGQAHHREISRNSIA